MHQRGALAATAKLLVPLQGVFGIPAIYRPPYENKKRGSIPTIPDSLYCKKVLSAPGIIMNTPNTAHKRIIFASSARAGGVQPVVAGTVGAHLLLHLYGAAHNEAKDKG